MEEDRSVLKLLTGKPTGKIPLGSPRSKWEDNIRMDLEEIFIYLFNTAWCFTMSHWPVL